MIRSNPIMSRKKREMVNSYYGLVQRVSEKVPFSYNYISKVKRGVKRNPVVEKALQQEMRIMDREKASHG